MESSVLIAVEATRARAIRVRVLLMLMRTPTH